MKSFIRKSLLGAAMVAPLVLALPGTANAAGPDAIVVAGTGSIDPGLPCATPCDVKLDFTAVFAGADSVSAGVTTTCHFDGVGGIDTIVAGAGDGNFSCANGASGSVHFDRILAAVTLSGSVCVSAGNCASIVEGVLAFVPLTVNPTTSFIVAGEVVVA
jgi:hypothetical protein